MASDPHTVGERASVPRIVLPLTRRGVELNDRACWVILAVAMVCAAALLLHLSRGTTFGIDELVWVFQSPGLGAGDVFDPYNGSLVATNRIVYKALLETVGAEYLVFRLLWVGSVLLSAGLLYVYIKRWIGALPALAPAIVLLFFGSAGEYFTSAIGFIALFAIAAGLAALLMLDRDDAIGDVAACALIVIAVATFAIGLAFLVGVAISVLLREDRWRRTWIFLIPLALYAAWWLWALDQPGSSSDETQLSNLVDFPSYVVDSLAAILAALTGLNYLFVDSPQAVTTDWGYPLAAVAVIALVLRLLRGNVPRGVWISLGILLTVWVAGTLVLGLLRPPDSPRYMYMGGVGVVMVAAAAATSLRFTRVGLAILFGVAAFSVISNVAQLRDRAAQTRNLYSLRAETSFAMLELARTEVDSAFLPPVLEFELTQIPLDAGSYLRATDRYGLESLPLDELKHQSAEIREHADRTLAGALELGLEPTGADAAEGRCASRAGGVVRFALVPGTNTMTVRGDHPAKVSIGRFAKPAVELGPVDPGEPATIAIPTGSEARPWRATVDRARTVTVCRAP